MIKHGWNSHGTPCCELAPLAQRPDHVTACGGTRQGGRTEGAQLGCATCWLDRVRAHVEVQAVHEFLYAPGVTFEPPGWQSDTRLMA